MKRHVFAKALGVTAATATGAVLYNRVSHATTQNMDDTAEQRRAARQTNETVNQIVGRTLNCSRKVLSEAAEPVQMKLGHEHEVASNIEPTLTLEFIDADNMKVEVPYPKYELIDNIGKLSRVADRLSNIFEKEFEYIA